MTCFTQKLCNNCGKIKDKETCFYKHVNKKYISYSKNCKKCQVNINSIKQKERNKLIPKKNKLIDKETMNKILDKNKKGVTLKYLSKEYDIPYNKIHYNLRINRKNTNK